MSIQDNINKVEVYYNGDEKAFDCFLESAVKGYISQDPIAPITEENDDDEIYDEEENFSLAI